jgi:predicted lactoylglutathione lyase
MQIELPSPVPEIPVKDLVAAMDYYQQRLGFRKDWGTKEGGIAQVSRGACRLFLADQAFREKNGFPNPPLLIWLNLSSKAEVDQLHVEWSSRGANIFSKPDSKPWHLHEFTASDLDGNLIRVFYDFAWELPDRGGRED